MGCCGRRRRLGCDSAEPADAVAQLASTSRFLPCSLLAASIKQDIENLRWSCHAQFSNTRHPGNDGQAPRQVTIVQSPAARTTPAVGDAGEAAPVAPASRRGSANRYTFIYRLGRVRVCPKVGPPSRLNPGREIVLAPSTKEGKQRAPQRRQARRCTRPR